MPTPHSLTLTLLPGRYVVCRLVPDDHVPDWAVGDFVSVTRTRGELSVVCPEGPVPEGVRREAGWRCLGVVGTLDFSLVGVLASLVGPLAGAGISVFAVSTFDTDYLLVREADLGNAVRALEAVGHRLPAG